MAINRQLLQKVLDAGNGLPLEAEDANDIHTALLAINRWYSSLTAASVMGRPDEHPGGAPNQRDWDLRNELIAANVLDKS